MPADAPALWSIAVVALVALAAAVVTFFSGFGLGTILMPALAFFVPPEIAIGATALVHLANNIFKLGLVGRFADRRVLIRFGLGTVPFTFAAYPISPLWPRPARSRSASRRSATSAASPRRCR
jgi:uncharacterized membrane protein YfcA